MEASVEAVVEAEAAVLEWGGWELSFNGLSLLI